MSISSKLLAAAGLTGLMASVSVPANVVASTGDPATPLPDGLSAEAESDIVAALQATATTSESAGVLAGTTAANERVAAVFADPAALANPKLAASLLTDTPLAADKIIELVTAQGAAPETVAAAPAAAPVATAQPTVSTMVAGTPAITRDPGNDGETVEATDLAAVFPNVDFSGKSRITEDGVGKFARIN